MGRVASLVAAVLALGTMAACGGDSASSSARADVQVMFAQELAGADVARVRVEVRGPGIAASLGMDLVRNGSSWQGLLGDIPAGADRVFEATAYDASSKALYRGQAAPITITPGSTAAVAILLQQVDPTVPFENEAPVIDSLVASANVVVPGGTLFLSALAHDNNPGDALSYAWTATAGTLGTPSDTATQWTAPATEGSQRIQLEVKDSKGATATISLDVGVARPGSTLGSASVTVGVNTWPTISAMMGAPSVLAPNVTTQLAVSAADPDGDALSYVWSSDCRGTFGDLSARSPLFTLLTAPATGRCVFSVSVSDGRGGKQVGSLTLQVGTAPRVNVMPQVESFSQSAFEATGGELVKLSVTARDPEGSPLMFSWVASQGSVRPISSSSTRGDAEWMAPACVDSTVVITASIQDVGGATVFHRFSVSPRAGSACGGFTVLGARHIHRVQGDGSVIRVPADLTTSTIGAWVPAADGTYSYRPGVGQLDGTFSIPNVESTPYLLRFGTSYLWTSSRVLDLSRAELGRPDVQPEPEGTQLALLLSGLSPWQQADDLQLTAAGAGIGYFTATSCSTPFFELADGETAVNSTHLYNESFQACGNSLPGRIEPARGDVLYATQLVDRDTTDGGMAFTQELRRGAVVGLKSVDGGVDAGVAATVSVSGTLAALPTTAQTFNVRASEFEALALAGHPAATLRDLAVNVGALPGHESYGTYVGWPDLVLARGTTFGQPLLSPVFQYANPYPRQWGRFVTASANAYLSFSVPQADGTPARASSFSVISYSQEPLVDGVTPGLTPRVGPARNLRLNGTSATGSLKDVGLSPLLSWEAPSLGTPTSYTVRVYRLFASSGVTRRTVVGSFIMGPATQLRLPPGLLATGQSYYIHLTAYQEPGHDPLKPYLSRPTVYSAAAATGMFQP